LLAVYSVRALLKDCWLTDAMLPVQVLHLVAGFEWGHPMPVAGHDIIVIGASAGGVEALSALVASLPRDLQAAIFIVMHIPAWAESYLPAILNRSSSFPAIHPQSGEPIQHGRIYVAPPDKHLVIHSESQVELWRGPKENGSRPSINALFRSAAVTFGPRVTGVILTGALDDGTTGLWWIKRMGGAVLVQDPSEAQFKEMPQSALSYVPAAYVAKLADMSSLLHELAQALPSREVEHMRTD
jgi:two-component system, chemotaxis family, protein-glutamate methylesterase/glutaminase